MRRITSFVSACAMALLAPGIAVAQEVGAEVGRATAIGAPAMEIASRPLHAETYAAVPGDDAAAQECRVDAPAAALEPDDPRWKWRLRAYRHLDCVMALIDAAIGEPRGEVRLDSENNRVPVSREDLERIRTLAWWARDAAARIGQ